MRRRLEHWFNQEWYGGSKPKPWLKAMVPFYRLGFMLDRAVKSLRRPANLAGRAILVVGNITAGGSGKTPLVIHLCNVLLRNGLLPGVISRGYGRNQRALLGVNPNSTAREVGDEPLLIAQRTGVPVVVGADRCAAAQFLFERGVEVVISDDGLQHHRLPRTVEICVVDGARKFGNGLMLPAGPLREPVARLRSCDYVVVNGRQNGGERLEDAIDMQLVPGLLYALNSKDNWRLSQFTGCRVNGVAAIGHSQRFFNTLQKAGLHVMPHVFADHHNYKQEDFSVLDSGLPIIMTEKDAVKCRGMNLGNAWYLSVEASLPSAWETELLAKLRTAVGKKAAKR